MSMQKNVLITSINKNLFILLGLVENPRKSLIMITFLRFLILMISLFVITYGFIMYVLFGFHNVIFSKKMDSLILKVYKILIKSDLKKDAWFVNKSKQELASNVKIKIVTNIIILNVPEKRKFIWNN
jgi:hypothetical protein